MKKKRCPYCGKRISYAAAFSSRRKAEYVCPRCGKQMRVVINKMIVLTFAGFAALALIIMAVWFFCGLSHNPLGILLVALPFIIFTFISPKFVNFVPLKKYKKSMEAKKAGIEYSDNLMVSELSREPSTVSQDSGQFQINADVFNTIRAERNAAREQMSKDALTQNSEVIEPEEEKPYVHVIDNVSEKHSYNNAPLKKIHSEKPVTASRTRHYITSDDVSDKKPERQDGNRYSSNRRF